MRVAAVQAIFRRLMIGNKFKSAMTSMGGVGSTALARHIGSVSDKTVREHAWSPEVYDDFSNIRLGYMYGTPYNAVLSLFRRNYQHMHAKAMHAGAGTQPADLRGMSLDEFLENGRDEFFIERQFNNWVHGSDPRHPIVLIKYDELSSNIDQVLEFFGVRDSFTVKQRSSDFQDQPEHIRKGLERIYGDLNEKILAMPGVKILEPKGMAAGFNQLAERQGG